MRMLYAVYDVKAKAYGPVVSAAHDAVATRDFATSCQDQRTSLHQYPEDFELHRLGFFGDDKGGVITPHEQPVVVVTAAAVKSMQAGGPELLKEA